MQGKTDRHENMWLGYLQCTERGKNNHRVPIIVAELLNTMSNI